MMRIKQDIFVVIGLLILLFYVYRYGILERISREIYNESNILWSLFIYTWLTIIYGYILYRLIYKKGINKNIELIIELIYYKPMRETYKLYLQYRKRTIKILSILGHKSVTVLINKRRLLLLIIICDILPRIVIVTVLFYEVVNRKGFNYFYKSLVLTIIILSFNSLIYKITENAKDSMNYWGTRINIISQSSTSIEIIGQNKDINLYVIHYNIIDTLEALKYIKQNNNYINKTYIMIYYYYFFLWHQRF